MALDKGKRGGRRRSQRKTRSTLVGTEKVDISPPFERKEIDAVENEKKNKTSLLESGISDSDEIDHHVESAAGFSGSIASSRSRNSGVAESSRGGTRLCAAAALGNDSDSDEGDTEPNDDSFLQFVIDAKPDRRLTIDDGDGHIVLGDFDDNNSDEDVTFTIDKVGSVQQFGDDDFQDSVLDKEKETNETRKGESDSDQKSASRIRTGKQNSDAEPKQSSSDKLESAVTFDAPCEIDAGLGLDLEDGYVDLDEDPTSRKKTVQGILLKSQRDKLIGKSVLTPDFEKKHSIPPYKTALAQLKKQRKKERESSKGAGWFGMKAAEMTDELRNDIKVVRMRSTLDPKRFYKGNDMAGIPKFVQVGTVVDSPVDFYHSRLPKKQRKQNLVEELLSDADSRRYNKRKYMELQDRFNSFTRGGKKRKFGKRSGGKKR